MFHWHKWGKWGDQFTVAEYRFPVQDRTCETCGETQRRLVRAA